MPNCRTCQAKILWLKNDKSRQTAPIDAEPCADGNIEVLTGETYRVVPAGERPALAGRLHKNHWVTCKKPPQRKTA